MTSQGIDLQAAQRILNRAYAVPSALRSLDFEAALATLQLVAGSLRDYPDDEIVKTAYRRAQCDLIIELDAVLVRAALGHAERDGAVA